MTWVKKVCNLREFDHLRGVSLLSVFAILGEQAASKLPRPCGWNLVSSLGFMKKQGGRGRCVQSAFNLWPEIRVARSLPSQRVCR